MAESERRFIVHRNEWIWGRTWVIVCEDGSGIIKISEDEDGVVLSGLSVLPDHRGKGIGTKILESIKEIAKTKGCTDLYLTVNQENENAIKVYEKFGFKVKNIAYMMKI